MDLYGADLIIRTAIADYRPRHVYALFSGGHDSLVATHVAMRHPEVEAVVHVATGTGIALRAQGVRRCITWLGISTDEVERIKPSDVKWQTLHWPLCFDVPMSRVNCQLTVRNWGWPDAPRSSCHICPHRQDAEWMLLSPEERALANQTDADVRARDPRHDSYLHHSRKPLATVTLAPAARPGLFDACDSGYCWT